LIAILNDGNRRKITGLAEILRRF